MVKIVVGFTSKYYFSFSFFKFSVTRHFFVIAWEVCWPLLSVNSVHFIFSRPTFVFLLLVSSIVLHLYVLFCSVF